MRMFTVQVTSELSDDELAEEIATAVGAVVGDANVVVSYRGRDE